jgi:hypothetical protein
MQHIIRHLFKADSLDEVPKERLEELVQEYPSFSIGHYLLSSKLRAEDAAGFSEETQKTNLYFPNPFWLQWLLQNTVKENGAVKDWPVHPPVIVEKVQQEPAVIAEPVVNPEPFLEQEAGLADEPAPVIMEEMLRAGRLAGEQEAVVEDPAPWEEGAVAGIREPEVLELEEKAATEEGYINAEEREKAEEARAGEPGQGDFAEEQAEKMEAQVEMQTSGTGEAMAEEPAKELSPAEQLLKNILEARSLRQSLARINERMAAGARELEAPVAPPEVPVPDEAPVAEMPVAEAPAEQMSVAEDRPVAEPSAAEMPVAEAPTEQMPVAAVAPPNEEPLFTSYHTIDYFASQGIKLSLDENPDDKLGKQMKSFTDWLKIMKRLPQKDPGAVPDLAAEHQVQAIAAHSIEGKEVLTETMAEVLAKQGMREKATEVYRKLSLLNPDKSSYFAARIEQLKIT